MIFYEYEQEDGNVITSTNLDTILANKSVRVSLIRNVKDIGSEYSRQVDEIERRWRSHHRYVE